MTGKVMGFLNIVVDNGSKIKNTDLHWISYSAVIFITVVPHLRTPVLFVALAHSCDSYPDGAWEWNIAPITHGICSI